MAYYIENKETGKIEMYFDKSEYDALTDDQKKKIRSNFLFSRRSSAWVSRCKFPNLYSPRKVAEGLGLENAGKIGERKSFEEMMNDKAKRAEKRADRMEYKAEKALERGEALRKPIEDMHGDIAFFTQPNINSAGGRSFTRRREKMFAAWERGFEEFKKSDYFAECAEKARMTANRPEEKDNGFCQRRIREAEKTIRDQRKNIDGYKKYICRIESGEVIKRYNGDVLTVDDINEWIENSEDRIENAIQKIVYYKERIEENGGILFSKENLNKGDLVLVSKSDTPVRIIRFGKVNFTFEYTLPHMVYADGTPIVGKAAYAEIRKVVKTA